MMRGSLVPKRTRNPYGWVRKRRGAKGTPPRFEAVIKYPTPGEPGAWKQTQRTFVTEDQAKEWKDLELAKVRRATTYSPPSNETVGQFLKRWLEESVPAQVRASTFERYRVDVKHLTRYLGDIPLRDLTPSHIERFQKAMLRDGSARSTVRHAHNVLHAALEKAVDADLLLRNPVSRVRAPRPDHRELQPPTSEQTQRLLQAVMDHRMFPLWAFLAATGCRRGEALALRWEDVDWGARTVTLRRTQSLWASKRRTEDPKQGPEGARPLEVSDDLMAILKLQQDRQALERLAAGDRWQEHGWVFTTRNGTWFSGGHVWEAFKRALRKADLPGTMRPHDLRHALATHWLRQGVGVDMVAGRLGHADPAMTLRVYAHVMPGAQREVAERLEGELLGPVMTPPSDPGESTISSTIKAQNEEENR